MLRIISFLDASWVVYDSGRVNMEHKREDTHNLSMKIRKKIDISLEWYTLIYLGWLGA